jgi:hypothetical protein
MRIRTGIDSHSTMAQRVFPLDTMRNGACVGRLSPQYKLNPLMLRRSAA